MCDKRKHTLRQARAELRKIKHGGRREERRVYRCKDCGWWHLTSEVLQPVRPYRRVAWRVNGL